MAAFNSLPWYSLPLQTQKDIAHILHRSQHGPKLTIGPFAELNYETATDVGSNYFCICLYFLHNEILFLFSILS